MKYPVVVDGRALQPGFKAHFERGIGRYARNLLAEIFNLVGPENMQLFTQANLEDARFPTEVARIASPCAPQWLPIGKRVLNQYIIAGAKLRPTWKQGRVVHFIAHLDTPLFLKTPSVITCHDLIAQRLPELYGQNKSGLRFRLERWAETRCLFSEALFIAPSSQTKLDLEELYGLDASRIRVIPEAVDPELKPEKDPAVVAAVLAEYGLKMGEPYFFYVGGIDQRKDIMGLLEAIKALHAKGLAPKLVMAGKIKGDRQYPALKARIEELGLLEAVAELGYVPDSDLPPLFAGAQAFVFPSIYEGFGLPPLEAMACGCPVVAAKASAVPEVVGRGGLLVEPGDTPELIGALGALLTNPELGRQYRDKGMARAAEFSWQKAARATLEVYDEAFRLRK